MPEQPTTDALSAPATHRIQGGDYQQAGLASRSLKDQLKKIGAAPEDVRRVMIAAYEAEMNVVIHARQGQMRSQLSEGKVEVEVADEGPGIADIELAMKEGYSTAPASAREMGFGAGMGLPNIKKNSDRFEIVSTVGKGTTVRFTVLLRAGAAQGPPRHSVRIAAAHCRACFRCLHVCPTRALRIRGRTPEILDHLCVDCTACIAECPYDALDVAPPPPPLAAPAPGTTLLAGAELLAQFGAAYGPAVVREALLRRGYAAVVTTAAAETALREAVVKHVPQAPRRPVLSPACPAVVNLIETRFPSLLPNLAAFVSPMEAAMRGITGPVDVVVPCPAVKSLIQTILAPRMPGFPQPQVRLIRPADLRDPVMMLLHGLGDLEPPAPAIPPPPAPDGSVLRATGIEQVTAVLEEIENGLLADVQAIELHACTEGCFGSPLYREPPHVARHRWNAQSLPSGEAQALPRRRPFTPRAGVRLDKDMVKAIEKLARIDTLIWSLPGNDCGLCGCPSCAALAEDVVLGRLAAVICPRKTE